MNFSNKEMGTLDYYNSHAQDWRNERFAGQESFWQKEIDKFHALLPQGRIIEIGSGSGREAEKLIKLGYEYEGTDVSDGLIMTAKQDNPEGSFSLHSPYSLGFRDNTFDGFWTAATLLHVPRERIPDALKEIKRVTKPEGIGFISLKGGEGEEIDKTGRLFTYYNMTEFSDVLTAQGLMPLSMNFKPQASRGNLWLTYLVRNVK